MFLSTSRSRIWAFRFVILSLIAILLPFAFQDFNPLPQDFISYWAAGRLLLSGANPYSPGEMLAEEQTTGFTGSLPNMAYYPPWVLLLFIPFGVLPFKLGWLAWFLLSFGVILICADWLWRYYGGPEKLRWIALLTSTFSSYTLYSLTFTQVSPWMLVGLVLFLSTIEKNSALSKENPLIKICKLGIGLWLISIKPQTLFLFWVILFLWILRNRQVEVFLVGVSSFLVPGILVTIVNSATWENYLILIKGYSPSFWSTPTIGFLLRFVFGWEHFWLQFPSILIGISWAVWKWKKAASTWTWQSEIPLLVAISLITAAYAWTYDQVLLIPAQMAVTTRLMRIGWPPSASRLALAWLILQAFSFLLHFWVSDAWFVWQAPLITLLYLQGISIVSKQNNLLGNPPF